MTRPRTINLELPDGSRVVTDVPPPFVMAAIKRSGDAIKAGRKPDLEDAAVAIRFLEEQERRHPTARAKAKRKGKMPAEGTAYPLLPLDMDRILQPGTLTQLLELEDSDPAESLMVEMPLEEFIATREQLADFVRMEGRSLFVILVDEGGAA